MQRAFEIVVKSIAVLVLAAMFFVAVGALGSNWRVASDDPNSIHRLSLMNEAEDELLEIPYVGETLVVLLTPRIVRVESLGAVDALINAFSLLTTALRLALLSLGFAGMVVVGVVGGVVTGSWDWVGAGLLSILGIFLIPLLVAVGTFAIWCELLIEPCTPAYLLIWIVVGLPFGAIGVTAGAALCTGAATLVATPGLVPGTWVIRSG